MRIIAGSARGLRLSAPAGLQTRPTADRVKEALFSIIASRRDMIGARVLDICAGTGSLGIESLSRGAVSCTFIEHDRHVMSLLENNLGRTGFAGRGECMTVDANSGLKLLSRRGNVFDIVFFDPPYQSGLYTSVIEGLGGFSLLSQGGLLIAECSSRSPLADSIGDFVKVDHRVYGDTALEFFARESA